MGLNVPTEISDYFWWGIWSRKLEEAIIAPPPVCLVGQVRLQQILWGWKAAITSIDLQNTKTISAASFVQRGVRGRPSFTNVPNVYKCLPQLALVRWSILMKLLWCTSFWRWTLKDMNDIRLISRPIHAPNHELQDADTNTPPTKAEMERRNKYGNFWDVYYGGTHFNTNSFCKNVLQIATLVIRCECKSWVWLREKEKEHNNDFF